MVIVNAKKWVNGQSFPHVLFRPSVSYSLQTGKMTWSQVKPGNSLESYLQKKKRGQKIKELFLDYTLMLKLD